MRRRIRHLAVALAAASMVTLGSLAGQARAGGSAAQDQYTPPAVATPSSGHPGASAPAPISSQGSTLPFTGLSLLKVVLVGAGLLLLGVLLRRGMPRRGP